VGEKALDRKVVLTTSRTLAFAPTDTSFLIELTHTHFLICTLCVFNPETLRHALESSEGCRAVDWHELRTA
jgi:hypothetical protein